MALTTVQSGMMDSVAQYYSFKNRIINGGFGIWQRGTSGFTTLGNYCADRWIASSNTSLSAVARSTDVPSGFQYSLSVAGTNYPTVYQRIESVNCTDLVGQNITISFWAKQTVGTTGANSMAVAVYSPTATDNYASVNTIASSGFTGSSSWTYYTYTLTSLPASVANGIQVVVYSNLTGASTFLTTGVQLEKGVTATSFDYRPYTTELQLCQRYYQLFSGFTIEGYSASALQRAVTVPMSLPVTMRVNPTRTVISNGTYTNIRGSSNSYAGFCQTLNTTYVTAAIESAAAGYTQCTGQTESLSAEL